MNTRAIDLTSGAVRRFVLFFCMTLLVLAIPAHAQASPVRLFIDPGHGGKDPGAVSGGLKEKDSNLKISKYVAEAAKRQGWAVKMSRTTDKFVPLPVRPRMANQWKATEFVSIHSNSTGSKTLGNATIWRTKPGYRLGREVSREINKLTPYKDVGNYKDVRGLAVLRGAKMDATLVEVLAVSPAKERAVLKSPSKQRAYAEAIVRGIAKHNHVKYVPPAKPVAEKKVSVSPLVSQPQKAQARAEATRDRMTTGKAKSAAKTHASSKSAAANQPKGNPKATADNGHTNVATLTDKPAAAEKTAAESAVTAPETAANATPQADEPAGLLGMLIRMLTLEP